jgi:hypothetical protein
MTGKGRAEIWHLAEQILAERAWLEVVAVIGHADLIGSDAATQKRREQRAMTVRRIPIEQGMLSIARCSNWQQWFASSSMRSFDAASRQVKRDRKLTLSSLKS